jgi:predicted DNA-binding transcriptional regulator AlpA
MSPRSKSRSSRAPLAPQPFPVELNDAQVLTVKQWSALAGISTRTAKRRFKAGDGPQLVQLSTNRVGVTVAAHKAWLERQARGAAA